MEHLRLYAKHGETSEIRTPNLPAYRQMTSLKRFLRSIRIHLERRFGISIFATSPHGYSLHADIRRLLPAHNFHTVFDVGANVGQSAIPLAEAYPGAIVHCFEPAESNYNQLRKATAKLKRIKSHQIGIGDEKTIKQLAIAEVPTRHYILDKPLPAVSTETISTTTLDDFCEEQSIKHVGFLKIDTEGYDLKVLLGASQLLSSSRIDLVQVEAGFGPENSTHVPYAQIARLLEGHGYVLFGFYEQKHEWKLGKPCLRRSDVVFLSRTLAQS